MNARKVLSRALIALLLASICLGGTVRAQPSAQSKDPYAWAKHAQALCKACGEDEGAFFAGLRKTLDDPRWTSKDRMLILKTVFDEYSRVNAGDEPRCQPCKHAGKILSELYPYEGAATRVAGEAFCRLERVPQGTGDYGLMAAKILEMGLGASRAPGIMQIEYRYAVAIETLEEIVRWEGKLPKALCDLCQAGLDEARKTNYVRGTIIAQKTMEKALASPMQPQ